MPKPQSSNRPNIWVEHDNRQIRPEMRGDRRVHFKQNRHGYNSKFNHQMDWTKALRKQLEEEDIDMGVGAGTSGKMFRGGKKGGVRKGSPAPQHYRRLIEGPSGWYRVTIPYGEKYEKNYLLKLLLDKVAPLPFWPVAWSVNGHTVSFFIDNFKTAERLLGLDKTIPMPNGFKLLLKVYPGTPNVDMTTETKEMIKLVMAKRYNAQNKALNLSKFHTDPDLQDVFCALFKPIVMMTVVDIIQQNIPDLEALDLHDNRITTLNFLKKINEKIPNLKILHLSQNKIRDIIQLDTLIGLPIVEIMLDGNPCCNRFKDREAYIRLDQSDFGRPPHCFGEVRKRFPKCTKLDGVDLPPPISFDISEEIHMPDPQQTFLCAEEAQPIVRQFLEQYFLIYDSDNRKPLVNAYHAHAVFSYTMAYPYGYGKDKNVAWLNWYNTDNRNILRVQDSNRRFNLLKQGQLKVIEFIEDMPQTKHDIHSFTVDLTVFTPTLMCLTVTGIFRELKSGHKVPPTRYFFRTMVIVPAGSGFCIANEELHVTNATPDQAKNAFKTPVIVQPTPGTSAPPSSPEITPRVLSDAQKQELVGQIAMKTGMNVEWSIKCLEGNDWDLFRASAAFDGLQSQGLVPPDAFIK